MTPMQRAIFICPRCDVRFYEPMNLPEYHHEETRVIGWPEFYIQQNAGIWPVTAPIARIAKPPGSRFLEIGGGYGFGLDFAIHERGWTGLGIDPSPLAERGRVELGLPVRVGYFPAADDTGVLLWDVIVATEVIEHMDHPGVLLRDIRDRIAPDGVVLLTTPDGGSIAPETPQEALEQILIPEIHMVFQTVKSLEFSLHEAGFEHVQVARDSYSVVGFASDGKLALDDDPALLRRRFRNYLDRRGATLDPVSDVGIGLLGRAMFDAANDGDFTTATATRARLFAAIEQRYGFDPATIETLPEPALTRRLAEMKDHMPFNFASVMYADAMRQIGLGRARRDVTREFRLAEQAATALIGALHDLFLSDGMTDDIAWHARAEQAIALAEAGDAASVARLVDLPMRGEAATVRRNYLWRGLIELINAGAIDVARNLEAMAGLDEPEPDLPDDIRRNAWIVLGQLALTPDGDPLRAIAIGYALGLDDPVAADLLLGGFIRLVNAARYDEAATHAEAVGPLCVERQDANGRDARHTLAIVIQKCADPAEIPALLQPLALPGERRDAIMLDAFNRLVRAGRHDEAVAMADAENIVSRAVARDDDVGRDARMALALLDLATGDPMDVGDRLGGIRIDAAGRRGILIDAFSRLVNAARYADAAAFAQIQDIASMIAPDAAGRDAVIGLAILDLVVGDPAQAPARIAMVDIDPVRRRQITLGAFVTLVNRGRYDEAQALYDSAPILVWTTPPARPDGAVLPQDADGVDASIALLALTLATGDPAGVPALLDRLPSLPDPASDDALAQAALRLVHLGRTGEAKALIGTIDLAKLGLAVRLDLISVQAGIAAEAHDIVRLIPLLDAFDAAGGDPARVKGMVAGSFVTAVNQGDFAAAALLRSRIAPDFANYAKASTDTLRSTGFALGVLDLQEPSQPHRAEAAFAAVRRGIADDLAEGETAPVMFWEALRGEIIALHRTEREAEAAALARAMFARYGGAPDDLVRDFGGAGSAPSLEGSTDGS